MGKYKSRFHELDGPVHYVDFGGDGPPMVLVHGLGGSHVNWLASGPLLARRHRVLALDLAGFGRTPAAGREATVEANAGLVFRFLQDVVGAPAYVVGASMGGLISLIEASAHPGWTLGTVLVDPAMPHPSPREFDPFVAALFLSMATPGLGEMIVWRKAFHAPARRVREMFELCCAEPDRIAEELVGAHVALATELSGREGMARAYLQATRSILRFILDKPRYERLVSRVAGDVLLIAGARDRLVRSCAALAVARSRPDWRFELFEDAGHLPHMELPERFAEVVLDWTDSLRAAQAARLGTGA